MIRVLVGVALLAGLMLSPLSVANHVQVAHGDAIVFDHRTGNEWWVEVAVSGGAAGSVASIQAMDTGGAWVTMAPHPEWAPGDWAASFHIEPGHLVKFRALWSGGDQVESCWFTHPAGVEQCATGTPAFDATFTGVRGNEWWVQANVASNGPAVSAVDVRLNGGAWQPMSKQTWAPTAWAASYHLVQGTIVQMRATATGGATDLSSCRQWIPASGQDATIVPCPGTQPPAFDATWTSVKGNEYWLEAVVHANAPVNMVLLMLDCDTAHDPADMVYRADWGKWVIGIHIPAGSVVTMTAYSGDGRTDTSSTYLWPQGTVARPCPAPWPQVGSHADVRFQDELRDFTGPGGESYYLADGLVHAEATSSGWTGTCQQRVTRLQSGVWSNVTETFAWNRAPPTGAVPARAGD